MAVKIEVNQISCGLLVVPNQIAHQNVENIIIDGNGLFKPGHARRMKEGV